MKKFFESSLGKAILDGLRVVVLAIIPVVASFLGEWKFDWKVLVVVAGLALLKVVDRYLHLIGKEEKNNTLITGLTRF
jgi:hypothetical protein